MYPLESLSDMQLQEGYPCTFELPYYGGDVVQELEDLLEKLNDRLIQKFSERVHPDDRLHSGTCSLKAAVAIVRVLQCPHVLKELLQRPVRVAPSSSHGLRDDHIFPTAKSELE